MAWVHAGQDDTVWLLIQLLWVRWEIFLNYSSVHNSASKYRKLKKAWHHNLIIVHRSVLQIKVKVVGEFTRERVK